MFLLCSQTCSTPLLLLSPTPIAYPKRPKINKPFLGAFKDKELRVDKDRCCVICHNAGLIAHIKRDKKLQLIDFYWCSHCKQAFWPNDTYIGM